MITRSWHLLFLSVFSLAVAVRGQQPQASTSDATPIYRLTVIGRSIKAINYGHRTEPTKIGFRGTALEPAARGEARVESKRGAVSIEAKFENLPPPTKFGREYLTYVLWAITPEGRATNMGEILLNHADKGKLEATTEFQVFGLVVTAEPYYAVTQPSDVVVMENVVRPDTVGKVQEVEAKYELLRRGQYTFEAQPEKAQASGKKLPLDRYEAVLELYQARNAVQIARSQGADRYATETFAKAEELLQQAENYHASESSPKQIVTAARAAAQSAEDARLVAQKRQEEERLALELREAAEREARAHGEAAEADRQRLEAESQAQARAENTAPPLAGPPPDFRERRARLAQQLNMILETQDTTRGLVMNLPDDFFEPGASVVPPDAREKLSKLAGVVLASPGLKVQVEGFTPSSKEQQLFSRRAASVQEYLAQQGVPAASITARGFSMRPPAGAGWQKARRVEIVISGEPIGVGAALTSSR